MTNVVVYGFPLSVYNFLFTINRSRFTVSKAVRPFCTKVLERRLAPVEFVKQTLTSLSTGYVLPAEKCHFRPGKTSHTAYAQKKEAF